MPHTDRRPTDALLSVARLGLSHSFFGQFYEAVVDIPGRVTREPHTSLFEPTSPTLYFVPAAPITRAALVAAAIRRWRRPDDRPRLATALGAVAAETALTVYLVRDVNARLFVAGQQAPEADRPALLRRWHRLNGVRLATEAIAWFALSGVHDDAPGSRR